MANAAVFKSAKATVTLNVGIDPDTGKMITKNWTISGLDDNPSTDGVLGVVDLAAVILEYQVGTVTTTVVKNLVKA